MAQQTKEITVRPLNTKDFWSILQIVRKGGKAAFMQLKQVDQDNEMGAAMVLLDIGLEYAEKDLSKLLADLAGMDAEQYNGAPFDTTLTIIEKLEKQEDLKSFFTRAAAFIKKFSAQKAG
jgi:hypothetical protein